MEKLPLVSIIMASLNDGGFIEDAILAIKRQRYPEIEHIIIDGASNDNTLDIIKKYEGSYNMRWLSEPDRGVWEAANKGLRKAHGEIIGFLGADDLYLPSTVSVVVKYFKRHPEVELIYGDVVFMDITTRINWLAYYLESNLPTGNLPSPAVFFRKSVVEKVGLFDENMRWAIDYEYWMRISKQCRVSKIEEFLAIHRSHLTNITIRHRQQRHAQMEDIRQSYGMQKCLTSQSPKIWKRLRIYATKRSWRLRFVFYYFRERKNSRSQGCLDYPWQGLIEFSGFRPVSLVALIIWMLPWVGRGNKNNWFTINMTGDYVKK